MPNNLRIGGTIEVFDEAGDTTAQGTALVVGSAAGIDVGGVRYDIEDFTTTVGTTGRIRRRLQPVIVTFRLRSIDMNLVAKKWKGSVDIRYLSTLEDQVDGDGSPLNAVAIAQYTREVLLARGTFEDVVTPDTDFGEIPITTVTMNCLQYLRAEYTLAADGQAATTAEVGEFANIEHGVHIVGGNVTTADILDRVLSSESYVPTTDATKASVATATDGKYDLTGARIIANRALGSG